MVAGICGLNKKYYGGAALDIKIWSNDNSESIKHPRRWLGRLMSSSLSLAKKHPWHQHSGLGLALARLDRCRDTADTIFEILLAALKYTSSSPRCISGPPRVFQPIYINILCPPSIVFFIIYATQARIFSFSFIVLILKKGSRN